MEWCRMFALRIFVFSVLLGCGLSFAMPDITQDSSNHMSKRAQKRMELLKTLAEYSKEISQVNATVQNMTKPDLPLLPLPKPTEFPAEIAETSLESSLPFKENIHTYDDYLRFVYGTQEGVNMLRKRFGATGLDRARAMYGVAKNVNDVRSAHAHYLKVISTGKCKEPKAQVIRVKDYYPDPSREYFPRCTILHRCGDFSGCCSSDAFHCVPSAIQEIPLPFHIITIGKSGPKSSVVETLLFPNHTACQCQPVNDLPRLQDGLNNLQDGEDLPSKPKCRECPVPFTSRIYTDGRCGCDCFDRQKRCLRIKRGRDPLSEIERRCVLANQCHIPDCEYGLFNPESGFCPRRHDEDQRIHRRPNQLHHNHRWSHAERE